MGRVLAAAAVLTGCLALFPASAHACSCVGPNPACQEFWKTAAVFDGTVTAVDAVTHEEVVGGRVLALSDKRVTLAVRRTWKGAVGTQVDVVTAADGPACGFDFTVGGRYLVFAYRRSTDGQLGVSHCGNTRVFGGTGASVDFLDGLARPATGGRVFGAVTVFERSLNPSRQSSTTPVEVPVRLSGGGGQDRTTRSLGGQYEFSGLSPGFYTVDVTVPKGYSTYGASRTVEIQDVRACAQADYSLAAAGGIAGRLLDPEGRPLPNLSVEAIDAAVDVDAQAFLEIAAARTEADGSFEIRPLPPGRYVLGVNVRDLPNLSNPYPRLLYPGPRLDPDVVEIGLGTVVQLPDWRIPPPPASVAVSGTVVRPDGAPADGIVVSAWDVVPGRAEDRRAGTATTDARGHFALQLRASRDYRFTLATVNGHRRPVRDAARITVTSGLPPLRLIIPDDRPPEQAGARRSDRHRPPAAARPPDPSRDAAPRHP